MESFDRPRSTSKAFFRRWIVTRRNAYASRYRWFCFNSRWSRLNSIESIVRLVVEDVA